jgi:hypothetical protein
VRTAQARRGTSAGKGTPSQRSGAERCEVLTPSRSACASRIPCYGGRLPEGEES